MSTEITPSLEINVECNECGSDLTAADNSNQHGITISVDPCQSCLSVAEKAGVDEAIDALSD